MKNNILNNVILFTAGAAVGSVVTWAILKARHEEEIDSIIESFSNRKESSSEAEKDEDTSEEEYRDIIENEEYANYSDIQEKEDDADMEKPYVISPEEFGDTDYDIVSLTYYADGVLTYESDEIVEDVDYLVGVESLDHFGEYEDDSVFVRNDALETDFEILKDYREYSEIS